MQLRRATYPQRLIVILALLGATAYLTMSAEPLYLAVLAPIIAMIPLPLAGAKTATAAKPVPIRPEPVLNLGIATGAFAERNHAAPMAPGHRVTIPFELAYRGIAVIGSSGTGKGRCFVQPIARDVLAVPGCGLFAFAVKPQFARDLGTLARRLGRPADTIHIIGPRDGQGAWGLTNGLAPDAVAKFVRTAFNVDGAQTKEQYFSTNAVNLVRSCSQMLDVATRYGGSVEVRLFEHMRGNQQFKETVSLNYDFYSLADLYHAPQFGQLDAYLAPFEQRLSSIKTPKDQKILKDAIKQFRWLARMDDKAAQTYSGIASQADTVLNPFWSSPSLQHAFCRGDFDLQTALNKGHLVVLDIPLDEYPETATLIYLLAFQQFLIFAQRRQGQSQLNPVFLLADEYAHVADAEHTKMFRTCREARIAPIIIYQQQSSLKAVLRTEHAAEEMLSGMATKIVLAGTDDPATVEAFSTRLGEAEIPVTSTSAGYSAGGQHNASTGSSTQPMLRKVLDAQFMRGLRSNLEESVPLDQQFAEAVIMTKIGDRSADDVVRLRPFDIT